MAGVSNVTNVNGGSASLLRVGQWLSAYGTGFDDNSDGALTYQWKVSSTSGGVYSSISGATGQKFHVKPKYGSTALQGKYLKCEMTGLVATESSSVLSSALGPVGAPQKAIGRHGARVARGATASRFSRFAAR